MKVGDYVRLDRRQGINRIDEIDEIGTFYLEDVIGDEFGDETFRLDTNDVINSSPNIIDLIEVGDYVNGTIVTKVVLDEIECKYIELDYTYNKRGIREKDIKSIVTKEQFEGMKYKIGG